MSNNVEVIIPGNKLGKRSGMQIRNEVFGFNRGVPGAKYDLSAPKYKEKPKVKRLPHDDITNLAPGFYQAYKSKEGVYSVEMESHTIATPVNIYGKTAQRVKRYWNKFTKYPGSSGVMLLGSAGGGKTLEADICGNLCILNGDLPVISLTGFKADEGIVAWMESATELAFYLDEFAKHFSRDIQELLLPMFTDLSKKFFFIIADNDVHTFSKFFRSRPGRLWYRKAFDKLEEDVVLEYLGVNAKMRDEFKDEFLKAYKASTDFTFDHLITIIKEHHDYPDESLEEMVSIVNVDGLSRPRMYYLVNVLKLKDGEKYDIDNLELFEEVAYVGSEIAYDRFMQSYYDHTANVYTIDPFAEMSEDDKSKLESNANEISNSASLPIFMRNRGNKGTGQGTKPINFNSNHIAYKDGAEYRAKVDSYMLVWEVADIGTYAKSGILKGRQY